MAWPKMESRYAPSLTYTVPASRDQAERWGAAVSATGGRSIEAWLAETADAALRHLATVGRTSPLPWLWNCFRVLVTDTSVRPEITREMELRGEVSGPFGIFQGSSAGPGSPGCSLHSLVHLPTRRILATLSVRKSCKALAGELAVLRVDWQETDPEKVLGSAPDREAAQRTLPTVQDAHPHVTESRAVLWGAARCQPSRGRASNRSSSAQGPRTGPLSSARGRGAVAALTRPTSRTFLAPTWKQLSRRDRHCPAGRCQTNTQGGEREPRCPSEAGRGGEGPEEGPPQGERGRSSLLSVFDFQVEAQSFPYELRFGPPFLEGKLAKRLRLVPMKP